MGWNSCYVKSKTEVFHMWIKLRNVSEDRIFKTIHNELNVTNIINDKNLPIRFALESIKICLCNKDVEKWTQSLNESDKLRTYSVKHQKILPRSNTQLYYNNGGHNYWLTLQVLEVHLS